MDNILIVNDHRDAGVSYTPFFEDMGKVTNSADSFLSSPRSFKLIVFTGGSDVNPELYKDTSPHDMCSYRASRDEEEGAIFNLGNAYNIPMFGICRGLQFLNVMNGGKLIHHLNGHTCATHHVILSDHSTFAVNSLHHQACILPIEARLLAWSAIKMSETYFGDKDEEFSYGGPEVEAVYFPESKSAGVQWHPEAMREGERGRAWARNLVRDLIRLEPYGFRNLYYPHVPEVIYYEHV